MQHDEGFGSRAWVVNSGVYTLAPGTPMGVYQMLSTCAGGEVVSSDQY
jgi:hypothetical protein